MPTYLWQDKLKREGKDPFQELLQLLANRQKDDVDCQVGTINWQNSVVYIQVLEGGVPDFLFCGHELNIKSEQKKHFAIRLFWLSISCKIGSFTTKVDLLFTGMFFYKPAKIFDCIFCKASFETASGRTIHLNTCKLKPSPVADLSCRESVNVWLKWSQ